MKKYLRHKVVQNALALYSAQFAEYLLPMITVPYLARVLHPSGWGLVVYAQNFSGWLILVLEYGFGFSATREIARRREDRRGQAEITSGVVGATLLLLTPAMLIAAVASFTVPEFREHKDYLALALLLAVSQGVRPLWFFQGQENLRLPSLLNIGGRLFSTAGIFLLVKTAVDGRRVLGMQAAGGVIVSLILASILYRGIPFLRPTLTRSVAALKMGWSIFLSRTAVSLYTMANTFILGLFASTVEVAYYGGAERIILAVTGLLTPLSQALYPRMSHLVVHNPSRAAETARITLLIFGAAGIVTSALFFAAAPLIIRILFGPAYAPAIVVLRVAALVVPFAAVSNILGLQWMLPLGMDAAFNRVSISAGVFNIVLAVLLAPRFGPVGMAWSVVAAQAFVTAAMWTVLRRSGYRFWAVQPGGIK